MRFDEGCFRRKTRTSAKEKVWRTFYVRNIRFNFFYKSGRMEKEWRKILDAWKKNEGEKKKNEDCRRGESEEARTK